MNPFALEHGRAACAADIAIYAAAVAILAGVLIGADAKAPRIELAALAVAGLAGWTFVEYAMHRFVLHGVEPFRRWHAMHHERPKALIGTPTILSALAFVVLAFLPAMALGGPWRAGAFTLGLVAGYLAYTVMHHATHHGSSHGIAWLVRRKRWHALHHQGTRSACFGVTTGFWDRAFGTAGMKKGDRG